MAPLISFVGYHNSGKTTFARKVIGELKKKGYRVGVIKSTHHTDIEESPKGKDTQLYISDGVESVALITPEKVYFEGKIDNNPEYIAFKLFEDFDLVVCEGFKKSPLPKIEVARKEISDKTLFERGEIENVIAVVSDFPVKDIKNFSFEQSREVAELIEEEFLKSEREEISLFVNGKKIPMKFFVRNTLKGIIEGFIENLKGTENAEKIEIKIER
jgi:molybdopterin-guanine dinucleotide biosynthesis protein B